MTSNPLSSRLRVASHCSGRVRVRGEALRSSPGNAALCQRLATWEGVVSVQGNPATGGILLHYDPARVAARALEERLRQAFGGEVPSPSPSLSPRRAAKTTSRQINRLTKVGLLVSMAATLLALQQGKRLHAAFGAAHLAFLLVHLIHHRSRLLR